MKELSIEQKSKAYDEIIKKANKMHSENCEACQIYIEGLIPELKESEDEKIRKDLLGYLHTLPNHFSHNGSLVTEWVAWLEKQSEHKKFRDSIQIGDKVTRNEDGVLVNLSQLKRVAKKDEKQGEQKPADKIEPKFKVKYAGSEYNVLEVKDIAGVTYYGIEDEPNHIDYVLPYNCEIVSEQKLTNTVEPKFKVGDYIERKDGLGCHAKIIFVGGNVYGCEKLIYPEDSSPFFEFMFKNQDEFQISSNFKQNPTWSEEDNIILSKIIADYERSNEEWFNAQKSLPHGRKITWLKSLKDRVQPKQEWKQENIEELSDFENVMMHIGDSFFGQHAGLDPNDTNAIKEQANILLELVPKQEWSEEDEKAINDIMWIIEAYRINGFNETHIQMADSSENWLKSLRPQNRWKPSEEQMNALDDVISSRDIKYDVLSELWKDLKKLREG